MEQFARFDENETTLIIGLGRSGLTSTSVLRARGVSVYVTDEKPPADLAEAIATTQAHGATFVPPAEIAALASKLTSAVLSPGVPLTSSVVRAVQDAGVPVLGEIEVAYRLCRAPIVAVTGTKGKSTTTALIGHLLRACGKTVHVGGNIGNPLIGEVVNATSADWVVAEVSSFQLETIRSFRPRVSVLLNVTPDHLDRYHSIDEYAEAKYRIFANQQKDDTFVGNLDDPIVASLRDSSVHQMRPSQRWFTLSRRPGDATMFERDGTLWYAPVTGDPLPVPALHERDIPLAGQHNVQNVMAALLAALAVGCDIDALRAAVKTFAPMAHRLQPVGEIDGVLYVDDSKSTNPGSVEAALRAYDRPIVLIAGGRAKGTAFDEMAQTIDERAKAVVLIGEAADEIAARVTRAEIVKAATLADAVREACERATRGDVVLLSPGCASFDMFRSAEDRGEQFTALVARIREHAGA